MRGHFSLSGEFRQSASDCERFEFQRHCSGTWLAKSQPFQCARSLVAKRWKCGKLPDYLTCFRKNQSNLASKAKSFEIWRATVDEDGSP
jgi:hypothetical protein